jgi:putative transposase
MPAKTVAKDLNNGVYFLTFTIERWYYIFDRHQRWQILADTIGYCRNNKGLLVYGFVFVLNHLHLIVRSPDTAGFIRDFKRHTAKALKENLAETEPTVLQLFRTAEGGYAFWKNDSGPRPILGDEFFMQKLRYVHDNPVRKQYVGQPEHWFWSSANSQCPLRPDAME